MMNVMYDQLAIIKEKHEESACDRCGQATFIICIHVCPYIDVFICIVMIDNVYTSLVVGGSLASGGSEPSKKTPLETTSFVRGRNLAFSGSELSKKTSLEQCCHPYCSDRRSIDGGIYVYMFHIFECE